MKRQLFFCFVFLTASHVYAQEWAPLGSEWHYSYSTWNPNINAFVKITSIADTTIAARPSRILERTYETDVFGNPPGEVDTLYMHARNDSVFFWEPDSNKFYLLYDFNVSKGDKWYVGNWFIDTVTIDSTSTITINSDTLKVLYISSNPIVWFEGEVIEKIGWRQFLLPLGDNAPEGPLRCYSDSVIGLYNTGVTAQCDSIIVNSINKIQDEANLVNVYPNPSAGQFTLEVDMQVKSWLAIMFYDLTGKVIGFEEIGNVSGHYSKAIDLRGYEKGIYSVQVLTDNGTFTLKVVIY